MSFLSKPKSIRLPETDADVESAKLMPPQYTEKHAARSDAPVFLVVNEKKSKWWTSIAKWILIIVGLVTLYQLFGRSNDGKLPEEPEYETDFEFADQPQLQVTTTESETPFATSCGDSGVTFYYPEAGVASIKDYVIRLNVCSSNLFLDASIDGGRYASRSSSVEVALFFESDIPDVFDELSYDIQPVTEFGGAATLNVDINSAYPLKAKGGCLIAHLYIGFSDSLKPADAKAAAKAAVAKAAAAKNAEVKTTEAAKQSYQALHSGPILSILVTSDTGSVKLANAYGIGATVDVDYGEVNFADFLVDNIRSKAKKGRIEVENGQSYNVAANVEQGTVAISNTVSKDFDIGVKNGRVEFYDPSFTNLYTEIGSGSLVLERASPAKGSVIDADVGIGTAKLSVDGDNFYGTFDVEVTSGSADVTNAGTRGPFTVRGQRKGRFGRKLSGFKGAQGEGSSNISVQVGGGTASLKFIKL